MHSLLDETETEGVQGVPVIQLPTGHIPAICKPPMCNPFTHSFQNSFQVEPADSGDLGYEGSLDFPIPSKDGTVRRFPLSGDLDIGEQPRSFAYGHAMNGINPFGALDRRTAQESRSHGDTHANAANNQASSSSALSAHAPEMQSTSQQSATISQTSTRQQSTITSESQGSEASGGMPPFPSVQATDSRFRTMADSPLFRNGQRHVGIGQWPQARPDASVPLVLPPPIPRFVPPQGARS